MRYVVCRVCVTIKSAVCAQMALCHWTGGKKREKETHTHTHTHCIIHMYITYINLLTYVYNFSLFAIFRGKTIGTDVTGGSDENFGSVCGHFRCWGDPVRLQIQRPRCFLPTQCCHEQSKAIIDTFFLKKKWIWIINYWYELERGGWPSWGHSSLCIC